MKKTKARVWKTLVAGALLTVFSTGFAASAVGTYVIGDANVLSALSITAGDQVSVPPYVFYTAPAFVGKNLSSLSLSASILSGSGAYGLQNPTQSIPIPTTPGPLAYIVFIGKGVNSMPACVSSETSTIQASAWALMSPGGQLNSACTVNGTNQCTLGPIDCGQFTKPTAYSISGAANMPLNFMITSISLSSSPESRNH